MREPAFWYRPPSLMSRLLAPLGAIYGSVTARRMARAGASAGIPVLCIGNYHLGEGHPMRPHRVRLTHHLVVACAEPLPGGG